jgi:tRNA nucleotidyltransferase (CCA-adding enzyme)
MNREQVELLDSLLKNQETRNIKGSPVTVTHATSNRYIGDVSGVVHRLLDIEPSPALFALIRLEDRIHLVARSMLATVNSSKVAGDFGGGGHLHASAATIKGETLPDTITKLWRSIGERSDQAGRVGDLMNRHVKTVTPDETVFSAMARMIRYGITVMPLIENSLPVALLKRSDLDKAIHHGFEKHPVWEFADRDFESLFAGSSVQEAERIIFSEKQKQIPILSDDGKSLQGILTRSTILSSLYEIDSASAGRFLKGKRRKKPLSRDVTHIVNERVAPKIVRIFKDVVTLSKEMDCKAYAVGGFVRDLLMNNSNLDIDIVIEGDGIHFAGKLADRLGARVRIHEKFATAVIIMKDGYRVDVATARVEYYDSPAALPNVEMGGIKKDLSRRDFSMNAMAVELSGDKGYRLIDHFGGQADIKDKAIRVLHNVSFIEDPTRAFRAVRFEGRFGFKIGRQTLALIKNALRHNLMDRLSGKRLFHELKLILSEKKVIKSLYRLDELGLLRTVSPELVFDEPMADLFERCEELITWFTLAFPGETLDRWQIRFMALVSRLGRDGLVRLFDRFPEHGNVLEKMEKCHQLEKKIIASSGPWDKWKTYLLLEGHGCDEIIFVTARTDDKLFRRAAIDFLSESRFVKADLTGKDLIEIGYKPSVEMGEILKELLRVKLTGEVEGRDGAMEYIRKYRGLITCHSQK